MQRMRIFIACALLLQVPVFAMDIPQLTQDMNWPILEQLIIQTNLAAIPETLKAIAFTSKKNNNFISSVINNAKTTEELINLLNKRAQNKVRAAEVLKTQRSKEWLAEYLKKAEGQTEFKQVRKDEQEFIKRVSVINPNLEEIENYIIQGVNINIVDDMSSANWSVRWGNTSCTALMWAAIWGPSETVKLLLAVPGINKNAVNKYGRTALDLATRRGNPEVIALLKAAGAKSSESRQCTLL